MPLGRAACRGVVQHAILGQTQPTWITDDVLVDAFHRFLNVSNAGRKRFGSNVPGPLESRRRASKRHMMGLTAAGPAIGPDLGALFGADKPGDQAWSWEAPSRAEQPRIVGRPQAPALPQWLSNLDRARDDPLKAYRTRLSDIRNTSELENLWSELRVEPRHAVRFSQLANAHFMENLKTEDMGHAPFLLFLRNPRLNIPEAKNTQALVEYAIKHGLPIAFRGPLRNSIEDALRLGTMLASELAVIVDRVPELCAKVSKDRGSADRWEFSVYWAIWRGLTSCKVLPVDKVDSTVIRKMVERISVLQQTSAVFFDKEPDTPDAQLFRLDIYSHLWPIEGQAKPGDYAAHFVSWTRKLAKLGIQDSDRAPDGLGWDMLKSMLNSMHAKEAESVMTVATSDLLFSDQGVTLEEDLRLWLACISGTRHVDTSPKKQRNTRAQTPSLVGLLDRVLLRNPSLAEKLDPVLASSYFRSSSDGVFELIWIRHWLPQYMAEAGMAEEWERKRRKVMQDYKERPHWLRSEPHHPFYATIAALRASRILHRPAQEKAMELTFAMYGPEAVVELYQMFERAKLPCRDPRPLAAVVNATCATNPVQALKYYKTFNRVPLRLCPTLPLILIEHGGLPRDEFLAMFSRPYRDSVPPSTTTRPPITRADLVHVVAYAYANQTSRPPRHRYRNVRACCLYLTDHRLPLTPLMSKSLVLAGIVAPLENNEWVSTAKLRWILNIVAELEHPDVAEQLDRLVWKWRGSLIKEARRLWVAAGRRRYNTVTDAKKAGLANPKPGVEEVVGVAPSSRCRPRRHRKEVGQTKGLWVSRRVWSAWRARYGGAGRRVVWRRLPRRVGGKDGHVRPNSPFAPRR